MERLMKRSKAHPLGRSLNAIAQESSSFVATLRTFLASSGAPNKYDELNARYKTAPLRNLALWIDDQDDLPEGNGPAQNAPRKKGRKLPRKRPTDTREFTPLAAQRGTSAHSLSEGSARASSAMTTASSASSFSSSSSSAHPKSTRNPMPSEMKLTTKIVEEDNEEEEEVDLEGFLRGVDDSFPDLYLEALRGELGVTTAQDLNTTSARDLRERGGLKRLHARRVKEAAREREQKQRAAARRKHRELVREAKAAKAAAKAAKAEESSRNRRKMRNSGEGVS